MNDIAPTHVKEGAVTMDAGEMRCDSAAAPEPLDVACARAPIGLLAELTHRCPLQCPYCSNPLDLERANTELSTEDWQKVMREAAQLGILQIHLSGGEPTVRRDLEDIIKTAADATFVIWWAKWQRQNADAIRILQEKHGVRILRTPPDILTEFLKTWDVIAAEQSAKDPFFKKVHASQRAYAALVVPAKRFMFPPYSFAANYYWPESAGKSAAKAEKK